MGSQRRGRGTRRVVCTQRGEHGVGPVCGLVLERFRFGLRYICPQSMSITYCFDVGVLISLAHGLTLLGGEVNRFHIDSYLPTTAVSLTDRQAYLFT